MLPETFPVLFLALWLDALAGYPDWIVRKAGHPVSWIGALIGAADRHLNKEHRSRLHRKLLGILALICTVACAAGLAFLLQQVLARQPFGWIAIALLASALLSSRSLYEHVGRVADALENGGLAAGRRAVSQIVGRDPEKLNGHGVARAAIESLAENASDGIVAPAFWFALFGLPGLAAYKAINTADSMIGHRTPRHEAFGWAAARLDDLVNLPASRLTAALFALAALLISLIARMFLQLTPHPAASRPPSPARGEGSPLHTPRPDVEAVPRSTVPSPLVGEGQDEGAFTAASGNIGVIKLVNASPRGAVRALIRDAHRHRSPNAGWPEAAVAGALGLKLAGPRSYGGFLVPDVYMGDGRLEAEASDIRRALALSKAAWAVMVVLIAALSWAPLTAIL
jgi:adenosylcobinamide-phosphate synthase